MRFRIFAIAAFLFVSAIAPAAELPKPARAFIEARCSDCHDADTKKGGLDLDSLSTQLDDPAVEARWTLAFDRVLWGEMPPKKKEQPPKIEREVFLRSLGGLLVQHDVARREKTGRVVLRRLNRVEYENTLHELLAIDLPLAALLPEDASSHGFDNVSDGLRLSSSQIEGYLLAADKALDAAIQFGPKLEVKKQRFSYLDLPHIKAHLAKPTEPEKKDRHYQQFRALPDALVIFPTETFGGTFLRDARANVAGNYRIRLSAYAYQSTGTPAVVAKVMVTNFVLSRMAASFDLPPDKPRVAEVTARMEEGEILALSSTGSDSPDGKHVQDVGAEKFTGSGMAVQWVEVEGPLPNEELLRVAAAGKLHEAATLRAQTERLLASPKADAFTRNFCGQWLNLRAIDATTPDRTLYPEFDALLRDAMVRETESFFDEVLRRNLGIATLLDSNFAMLNRRLAEHYGIPGVQGDEFRKVALPPGSHRGGLLTQASILKVTANGTLSSPVVRGAWVLKRILGRELSPPPADAGSIEPDTRGATTIREQLAKHRRSESCAACHQYMDPPGFALESYDVIGGWRTAYRTQGKGEPIADPLTHRNYEYRRGAPVDASGELADGRTFADLDGLKNCCSTSGRPWPEISPTNSSRMPPARASAFPTACRRRPSCNAPSPMPTASARWSTPSCEARFSRRNNPSTL